MSIPIYILHDTDRDGIMSAYAAFKAFGPDCTFVGLVDRKVPPEIVRNGEPGHVYVMDYSFPLDQMEALCKRHLSVAVYDHHKSFAEQVASHLGAKYTDRFLGEVEVGDEVFWYAYDVNKSGCGIAWGQLRPNRPTPAILRYTEDYDIWRWALPHTDEVTLALDHVVQGKTGSDLFRTIDFYADDDNVDILLTLGTTLADYRDGIVDEALEGATMALFPVTEDGSELYPAVVLPATHRRFGSKAAHVALDRFPEAKISVLQWFDYKTREVCFGLRSRGDVDCGAICRDVYGGGGHVGAAGFRAPMDDPDFRPFLPELTND